MPYKSNADLPDNVKNVLPADAQSIWRNAFNTTHAKTGDEDQARQAAWGAVKNAGYVKKGDNWIKMQFKPPEAGDAPKAVQDILASVYNNCRSQWVKDHPQDKENQANKTSCARIAWNAVEEAGWSKDADGNWKKMEAKQDKFHEFDAEVFSVGTWTDSSGRTDTYTLDDLKDMVNNFHSLKDHVKPPFIKIGHSSRQEGTILKGDQPALGWITNLRIAGDKLIATLSQVPDILKKAIDAGLYKRISSEIYTNYKHAGKVFKNVLARVALLGATIPAVDNLADLDAYLSQSTSKGSFDAISLYAFETDEAGKIINQKTEDIDMEKKEYEAMIADLKEKLAKFESDSEADKKEKKKLEDQLAKFEKEREDEKRESAINKVKTFCEDMVKAGKMLPYQRDILIKDIEKRSFSTEDGFNFSFEMIEKMFEKVDKILDTGEHAHDKDKFKDIADPSEKLAELTKEYMREHKGISYQEASDIIFEKYPKLAKAYATDEGGED